MARKLAGVVFAVSALHTSVVSALGLGEIELKSTLNQPLSAEIALVKAGDLNSQQISVKLADKKDFDRAGVDKVSFLRDLKFTIQLDGRGGGVIKVLSEKLVREPFLDFVLEARWPDGRLLREYTLLIDLPTFSDDPVAAPLPAVSAQASKPATQSAVRYRAPAPAPSAAAMPVAPGGEVLTRRNDSLWGITSRVKPSGATMQQAMMAIFRKNPHAFDRQNINGLRKGQVLRLPTNEEYASLTRQQAISAVARQNDAWRTGSAMPLEAGTSTSAAAPVAAEESFMKLASADAGSSSTATNAGGEDTVDDGVVSLQSELVSAAEKLDRAERENVELDSRMDELQGQIATLEKLIELKDQQLASLQVAMTEQAQSKESVDLNFVAAEAGGESAQADTPSLQDEGEPSLMERLTSLPMLGLLGLLSAGGVAGLVWRRRSSAELDDEEAFVAEKPQEPASTVAAFALADEAVSSAQAEDAQPQTVAAELEPGQVAQRVPQSAATATPNFDPVAEAEIYCSYGRHDEAIGMLRSSIEEDAGRSELYLKLLSILAELEKKDDFISVYEGLVANGDEDTLMLAGHLVSDKGWLDSSAAPGAMDSTPSVADWNEGQELEFELDLDLENEALAAPDTSSPDTSLNLVADLDAPVGELEVDSAPLDFDLHVQKAEQDDKLDLGLDIDQLDGELPDGDGELAVSSLSAMLNSGTDLEDKLDDIAQGDEIATKLDLARAYVDMGDEEGAREILDEVLQEGSGGQRQEASDMLNVLAG